jgi:glutamate dehydrogenase (NAD(P)+)
MTENLNKLCQNQLKNILDLKIFDTNFINKLMHPDNEIIVNFPVKLENGDTKTFKGYRIQHNNLLGPYKGGLRFNKICHLDECKALAFWMTIKCSLQKLPLGGGKGGIKFNPREYSETDLKNISKSFSKALSRFIGGEIDVPAPDVGSNSQIMDWMTAAYQQSTNTNDNSVFTGKSLKYGGSKGRTEATGRGLMMCLQRYFQKNNIDSKNKTFIIQGFGNVGSFSAKLLCSELGMKCIGVGDHTGYIKNESGYNIEELSEYCSKNRSIDNYQKDKINKDEFFSMKTDVLVLAALELQICDDYANKLNCELIIEGANGPINLGADKILHENNITVLPDVLVNSGGVAVSYFEWLQNRDRTNWSKEKILNKLQNKMNDAFDRVYNKVKETGYDWRTCSFISSLEHLNYFYDMKN